MSYILDALVKADRERQRQEGRGFPGILLSPVAPSGSQQRWPVWVGGMLLLAAAFSLAWDRQKQQPAPAAALPVEERRIPAKPVLPPNQEEPKAPAEEAPQPHRRPDVQKEAAREAPAVRSPATVEREKINKPESRLYSLAELPPALQKEAQKISVAGFAQANDVDERMAIINDRALREGDEVTTGLRVEHISKDGVIFNLRGYRFRKGGA